MKQPKLDDNTLIGIGIVMDCLSSLLTEEGFREYLSAYNQGCRLMETMDGLEGRTSVREAGAPQPSKDRTDP